MSLFGVLRSTLRRRFRQGRHRVLVSVADEAIMWHLAAAESPMGRVGAAAWRALFWTTARIVPHRTSLAWHRHRDTQLWAMRCTLPTLPGLLERAADQAPAVALTALLSARAPVPQIARALVRGAAASPAPVATLRRALRVLLDSSEGHCALVQALAGTSPDHAAWRLVTGDDLAVLLSSSAQECRLWALTHAAALVVTEPSMAARDRGPIEIPGPPAVAATPHDGPGDGPSRRATMPPAPRPRSGRAHG